MAVGEKLKRKKTTAFDLPEEVIRLEILTRLPIKSVTRFKTVSKSWLSLFSHPQFVNQHLTCSKTQNPNDYKTNYDCLIAKKQNKIVIVSRYKETFVLSCDRISLIGSVRGLVCLRNYYHKLSLWNPSIHQSKEFTIPLYRSLDFMFNIGLGFDRVSNDYKVVVLSRNLRFASVYCSNSDSWIDISVPDNVFVETRGYDSDSPTTIVNDCPYWTFARYSFDRHPYYVGRLVTSEVFLTAVKFDAGSNEFKVLPQFYFDISVRGASYAFSYEFVDVNDRLTLIVYDRNSSNCTLEIYSLDGEEGCCIWNKIYDIGRPDLHMRHVSLLQGFYGGEIVFHNDGLFSCYDHKTDTIKRISTACTTVSAVSCFRYTPSLVFLEGMKSVYLTTQARRTAGLCSRIPRRLVNSLRK